MVRRDGKYGAQGGRYRYTGKEGMVQAKSNILLMSSDMIAKGQKRWAEGRKN
jgi:hypothetical protein